MTCSHRHISGGKLLPLMLAAVFLFAACEQKFIKDWDSPPQDMAAAMGTVPDSLAEMNLAPLVKGYYEGGDLYFMHTEASDSAVAGLLTEMMGPRVVHLPELGSTPDRLLADVYVFQNGVEGHGPFGFQPDLFGSVPGDSAYRPLRTVHLVRWREESGPRELKTIEALRRAESAGELAISEPGIVVNMPVLAWPGGHR